MSTPTQSEQNTVNRRVVQDGSEYANVAGPNTGNTRRKRVDSIRLLRNPAQAELIASSATDGPKRAITWKSSNLAQHHPADDVRAMMAMVAVSGRVCEGVGSKYGIHGTDARTLLGMVASAGALHRIKTRGGVDWCAEHSVYFKQIKRLVAAGVVQRVSTRASGYAQIEVTPHGQRVAAEVARKIEAASNELREAMQAS